MVGGLFKSPKACDVGAFKAAFRWWFGLTDYEAEWLVYLYGRHDRWTSTCDLTGAFRVSKAQVRCQISRLRTALEAEALDSAPHLGYRLTDSGMGECRGALWRMGEELRRA